MVATVAYPSRALLSPASSCRANLVGSGIPCVALERSLTTPAPAAPPEMSWRALMWHPSRPTIGWLSRKSLLRCLNTVRPTSPLTLVGSNLSLCTLMSPARVAARGAAASVGPQS